MPITLRIDMEPNADYTSISPEPDRERWLWTRPDGESKFSDHVLNKVRRRQLVGRCWQCSPVYTSGLVHSAHLVLALLVSSVYVYFAIHPLGWMPRVCQALRAPEWMAHLLSTIPVPVIALLASRCSAARAILLTRLKIFDDAEVSQNLEGRSESTNDIDAIMFSTFSLLLVVGAVACWVVLPGDFFSVIMFFTPFVAVCYPLLSGMDVLVSMTFFSKIKIDTLRKQLAE